MTSFVRTHRQDDVAQTRADWRLPVVDGDLRRGHDAAVLHPTQATEMNSSRAEQLPIASGPMAIQGDAARGKAFMRRPVIQELLVVCPPMRPSYALRPGWRLIWVNGAALQPSIPCCQESLDPGHGAAGWNAVSCAARR